MTRQYRYSASIIAALLATGCAPMIVTFNVVDFPKKEPLKPCDTNGNCPMQIYARTNAKDECEVMPEFDTVRVGVGYTPNMRWEIEPLDTDGKYEFRFKSSGIVISGNTPADFSGGGFGSSHGREDKAKFTWKNNHGRSLPTAPFDYEINVERSLADKDAWSPCTRVDPKIVNE